MTNRNKTYGINLILCILLWALLLTGCSGSDQMEAKSSTEKEHKATGELQTEHQTKAQNNVKTEPVAKEDGKESEESTEPEIQFLTAYDKYCQNRNISQDELIIELDPGHGGYQDGAFNATEDVPEDEVNLKIAQFLKAELETFDHVTVYMTREDDTDIDIDSRVQKALDDGAHVLISLHNNAKGDIAEYTSGCTVLTPRGVYDKGLSQVCQELACCVLQELELLGIENQGLLYRVCQNGTVYPDGSLCDYYGIIRNGVLSHIPAILIEHSFIDTEYELFLSDDEKLEALALADARGIASYFGLERDGISYGEIHPYTVDIMTVVSDYYQDNRYKKRTFFKEWN